MKFLEFDARSIQIIKLLEFHARIMTIIKILEFHKRATKNKKNQRIQSENREYRKS